MRVFLAVLFFCIASIPAFASGCRLVNNTTETLSVQVKLSNGSLVSVAVGPLSFQTVSFSSLNAVGIVYDGVYYANSSMPVDTDSPAERPMEVSQQLLQDAIEYAFSYRN